MRTQENYQRKYVYGDTRVWLTTTICVTVLGLCIYTAFQGRFAPLLVILTAGFIFLFRGYRDFLSYRKVLLFDDRILIQGIAPIDTTEIYFDNIENIGYLNVEIDRTASYILVPLDSRSEASKLVIQRKQGERVILPQLAQGDLDEILQAILPNVHPDAPAEHFEETPVDATAFKGRYSQVKFNTGKTTLIVSIVVSALLLLVVVAFAVIHVYALSIFFGLVLFGSGFLAKISYTDYKEILVYDDKIRIVDISRQLIREIYFSDIKNVGFLHGAVQVYHREDSEGERSENMVLLMYDGSREDLGDDISNIHQLCAIIQEKVN